MSGGGAGGLVPGGVRGGGPGAQVSAGQPAAGVINDQIRNAKPWPWR